ncbi:MFS transporter [Bacillus sp. BP-3]|uniref:MFS transporter n=1 Tax=Bacillus sp. BP-3 TaxID=3022773 RepID=UPI00232FDEAA|nr:MFS transporter [Bacillus sp. BP-3]MDC2865359.1 MFS transporter [Bacillus sp. BP-3]
MDNRIYLLTIITFVVGLAELIIGGILPLIAEDLDVSYGQVGMLISMFSLSFAISGPILLSLTSKIERKRLFLIVLLIFFLSNLIIVLSDGYIFLMVARILSAMCAALLISLCVTIASQISDEAYRARAIGFILMGVSASLVLGVPFSLWLGNELGWRAPFLFIAILTLILILVVFIALGRIEPKKRIPLKEQVKALKNRRIILIQLTSIIFFAGHMTLYAYLTPFLQSILNLTENSLSLMYFIIGLVAMFGSLLGGFLTDRVGANRTIILVLSLFTITIITLPFLRFSIVLLIGAMLLWSLLSWSLQPAIQSYLVSSAPTTSDIQQSLNNSGVHIGMAIGSTIGGTIIDLYYVELNAIIGGAITCLALLITFMAFKFQRN